MEDRGRHRYEQNYSRCNFRGSMINFNRQNSRGEYRSNYGNESYDRSRNRLRQRSFPRSYNNSRNRSTSNSRSRSGSRASMNTNRIRCYKCREYDHFAKDCPTSKVDRGIQTTPKDA